MPNDNFKVEEVKDERAWEDFLSQSAQKTFLQSWAWGDFNRKMGERTWRLGVCKGSELKAVSLVVLVCAKRGKFLLLPHGPVMLEDEEEKTEILQSLLKKLKEIGKENGAVFIRVSPISKRTEENEAAFKKAGFREAPIHAHPESSWKLDIMPSQEEIMAKMRKTTRYLIRQALENKDIKIEISEKPEDVEKFNDLYLKVVEKQHFVPFSIDYLKKEFQSFLDKGQISLFFAKYKGKIAASSFVIFWSGIGFYHHAALLPEFHKLPLAYLLQWEAIREAKRRNCFLYDFWGYADPLKTPNHPWAGPTLFKMGFGGSAHFYVKTKDFPLSKKYWLTYVFERIRKAKRGL